MRVVSRAFDVLRCFEGQETLLGNLEISRRCALPPSMVSRLTHTLTRLGQLTYLPQDQKYRIGPGAVALSASMMRGDQARAQIRLHLNEFAERIPGLIGLAVPDHLHLVCLELVKAANVLSPGSGKGSRLAMANTAAGHAYTAAIDTDVCDALLVEIERENPEKAKLLRSRIEGNRLLLRQQGYILGCGLLSPHINGIAAPVWSSRYQTFVVATIGLSSATYDEERLHEEVAPRLLELSESIRGLLETSEG
jgi:DNA-binding IclR family transcriptional regulator